MRTITIILALLYLTGCVDGRPATIFGEGKRQFYTSMDSCSKDATNGEHQGYVCRKKFFGVKMLEWRFSDGELIGVTDY